MQKRKLGKSGLEVSALGLGWEPKEAPPAWPSRQNLKGRKDAEPHFEVSAP